MGNVILVCGLNGAGKSTLAKALAERLNLRFVDIEDIYFSRQDNPDYPYEKSRPYGEVVSLLTDIVNNENDEYMIGVYNGIEIALAMLENREPIFKTATKEPEVIEKKEQSGRTVVSGVRIRRKDM